MPEVRPLSREEVRGIDQTAIEQYGLPGVVLMENAGRGATDVLLRLGVAGRVLILAGVGNNGGDGFVIARHLELAGIGSELWLIGSRSRVGGDARVNLEVAAAAGFPINEWSGESPLPEQIKQADWIVDGLLGTGAQGEVRSAYDDVIAAVNESAARVVAIDLPSGLDCDTGQPLGCCVQADDTITFVAPKLGFSKNTADQFVGRIHVVDIGVPLAVLRPFLSTG